MKSPLAGHGYSVTRLKKTYPRRNVLVSLNEQKSVILGECRGGNTNVWQGSRCHTSTTCDTARRTGSTPSTWRPRGRRRFAIGERRCPDPRGQPGYLRVDTVHQGDQDGRKGVYHINAVDTVTQWEVVGCTAKISERYLIPVLEAILHKFPFRILGFHADNGSEYINGDVARLLEKLRAEFTKSRAYRTQDNALVEGKNGAVIRKHMGYQHIGGEHAEAIQKYYTAHLNPYLNYHRPCGFATVKVNQKGKRKRVYRIEDYATPYAKLKLIPQAEQYLKAEVTWEKLDRLAGSASDTEFAQRIMRAKSALLRKCRGQQDLLPPRP